MDQPTEAAIIAVLNSYVSRMDQMRRQANADGSIGLSKITKMNELINQHANRLMDLMPTLNLHELTALDELVGARLAMIRMLMANGKAN